jgi:hypothetical protein
MVFSANFNNVSVISWPSVLFVEETEVRGENHRPTASHWQTLSHNVVSSTPRLNGIRTHKVGADIIALITSPIGWSTTSENVCRSRHVVLYLKLHRLILYNEWLLIRLTRWLWFINPKVIITEATAEVIITS